MNRVRNAIDAGAKVYEVPKAATLLTEIINQFIGGQTGATDFCDVYIVIPEKTP